MKISKKHITTGAVALAIPAIALAGLAVFKPNPSTEAIASDTIQNGDLMQFVTNENCPIDLTWVVDARDDKTYWIQKITGGGAGGADLCWMQTNLAYEGDGDDTYGDAITLTEFLDVGSGTGMGNDEAMWVAPTPPQFDAPLFSMYPDAPYTDSGADSYAQYGYLYNWCAAMGGQSSACNLTETDQNNIDETVSICPAGWRMPIAYEYLTLNNAVNNGSATDDSGLLNNWLGVYAGILHATGDFAGSGLYGYYWSSTVNTSTSVFGLNFGFNTAGDVIVTTDSTIPKNIGASIRCVTGTPLDEDENNYMTSFTLSPNQGTVAGGTKVTITGEGIGIFTKVLFGEKEGTDVTRIDDNTLTVITPAHETGTVDVWLQLFEDGVFTGTAVADAFTFVPGVPNTSGAIRGLSVILGSCILATALFFLARKKELFGRKTY